MDNEYLLARGIRIPGPQFVIPAFEDLEETEYDKIAISIFEGVSIRDIEVKFNKDSKKWEDASIVDVDRSIIELLNNLLDIYAKQKGLGKIEYRDKDSEHVKDFNRGLTEGYIRQVPRF